MRPVRPQSVFWLLVAGIYAGGGCGGRTSVGLDDGYGAAFSNGGAPLDGGIIATGAGGAGAGASKACSPPSCTGCGCVAACTCATGDRAACRSACGSAQGCTAPACNGCDTCLDSCLCATGDTRRCVDACGPGVGAGGAWSTGGAVGVAGAGGGTWCSDGLWCGPSPDVGGVKLDPCCRTPYACGLTGIPFMNNECLPLDAPGYFDPSCPSFVGPDSAPIGGCCTPAGWCGFDLGVFGLGCLDIGSGGGPGVQQPCGGGAPGYAGGPGTGATPGYGGSGAYGAGGYGAVYTTGGSGQAGGIGYGGGSLVDPVTQCVAQAGSECEVCACSACFGDLTACFADAGCPVILQCANLTGCSGADCLQASTCQSVIDEYGGIGSVSTQLAIPLFQCLQGAGCPCGFAGGP